MPRGPARRHAITGVVAILLAASYSRVFAASSPDKACPLLTAAEITAAMGAPTGSQETKLPVTQGPAKGDTTRICSWITPSGALNVAFAKAGEGATRQAFLDRMAQTQQTLKTKGWTIGETKFGTIICWTATPPASDKGTPRSTGCVGVAKGLGVSVGTAGPATVDVNKVKALLDAALARVT
jgi:hypothetical protein